MAKIDQFFAKASEIKASGVHIAVGNPPMFRHLGELKKFKVRPLSSTVTKALIDEILTPEMQKKFEKDLQLDFCYEIERNNRYNCE
jgi:twitching motility protein PilT